MKEEICNFDLEVDKDKIKITIFVEDGIYSSTVEKLWPQHPQG